MRIANGFIIVLGIVWVISVIVRACIYVYIASKHNRRIGSAGTLPLESLWYYTRPVSEDFERLRARCNFLQTVHIIVLIILIIYNSLVE